MDTSHQADLWRACLARVPQWSLTCRVVTGHTEPKLWLIEAGAPEDLCVTRLPVLPTGRVSGCLSLVSGSILYKKVTLAEASCPLTSTPRRADKSPLGHSLVPCV